MGWNNEQMARYEELSSKDSLSQMEMMEVDELEALQPPEPEAASVAPAAPAAVPNMSVGNPAPVIPSKGLWGHAKELAGDWADAIVTPAQDFSTGQLRGMMGAPAEPTMASVLGRATVPKLPERFALGAGRAFQSLNPFVGGSAGEKVFDAPEVQGLVKRQQEERYQHHLRMTGKPALAQQLAEQDQLGEQIVGGFGGTGASAPIGFSASAKLATKLPVIGKVFPKFSAFLAGALEAGVTMPVYGALGAEEGERGALLEMMLTNPSKEQLLFMALGGAGASMAKSGQMKAEAKQKANFAQQQAARERQAQVAALVSADEMRKLADELEYKAALDKGEIVGTGPEKPMLDYEQNPPPMRGYNQDPVEQMYGFVYGPEPVVPWGSSFKALDSGTVNADPNIKITGPVKSEGVLLGAGKATRRPLRDTIGDFGEESLRELPPEFPVHVAVVESPTAKYGTRAVIEWAAYGAEPRLEVFELNLYDDAVAFRKSLDKTGLKPEVSFSTKAQEALAQFNDSHLNDLLIFSAKERSGGKRGSTVKNRTAALVVGDGEAPMLSSLTDRRVKAQAADNINVVVVGTKNGPRFARVAGEIDNGQFYVTPLRESDGLPTINESFSVPVEGHGRYLFKPETFQMEDFFRSSKMPHGGDKLLPLGTAAPAKMTVRRQKTPWTVTNPDKTRADPTMPKIQRQASIPTPIAAAVAETAFGRAYGFEAGGHQGPIAGAGGTKKGNVFQKSGPPPAGGGSGQPPGGRPPGAPVGPEPVPMPERKPQLHEIPETALDNMMGLERMAKMPAELLKRWQKLVVGEHHSAPVTLQQQVAMNIAAKGFDRVRGDLLKSIHKAVPGMHISDVMDKELVQVGKGNMPFDQWAAKHLKDQPQAAAALREILGNAMARRDFLHSELKRMGVIHPRDEMFVEGDMQRYFARVSAAFVLPPGKWLKMVEKDRLVWNNAKAWLLKHNPDLGAGDVDDMMRKMLTTGEGEGFLFTEPKLDSAASHIKSRKKMPPELQALYGQDMSGAYGFAETLAAQEVLYHKALVMEEFAAKPEYALRALPEGVDTVGAGSGKYAGWTRLDKSNGGSRPQHGKLFGMYIHPDLKDAVVNLPRMHEWGVNNGLQRAAREISSWTKMNETALGGPQFYMNNLLGGIQHVMMAGVAPWEMPSLGRKMAFVAQGLHDYKLNPYAETPGAQFVRDALRVGGDVAGFGAVEVANGAADDLATTLLKTMATSKDSNPLDKVTAVLGVVHNKSKNMRAAVGGAADWLDRMWRLSTLAQLTDANLAKGMDKETALRTAARRVSRAFPMPDRLGVIPDQMRRRFIGIFTPYLTYRTEVMRNYMMLPGTIAEDPKVAINLAAWGIALYGAKKFWDAQDPTPEELLKKERARMPANVEKYRPFMVSAHQTGIDGRPVFYDITPVFEPLRYLQGPPEHPFLNVGMGALSSVMEGGALGDRAADLAGAAAPNLARQQARRREWNTGALAVLDTAWNDLSLLPKAPLRIYNEWESTQPQPSMPKGLYQQQDPSVAVQRGLGMNLVRQPNPAAVGMDQLRNKNALLRNMKERGAQEGTVVPGRGLLQDVFGNSRKEDLERMKTQYNERKKK